MTILQREIEMSASIFSITIVFDQSEILRHLKRWGLGITKVICCLWIGHFNLMTMSIWNIEDFATDNKDAFSLFNHCCKPMTRNLRDYKTFEHSKAAPSYSPTCFNSTTQMRWVVRISAISIASHTQSIEKIEILKSLWSSLFARPLLSKTHKTHRKKGFVGLSRLLVTQRMDSFPNQIRSREPRYENSFPNPAKAEKWLIQMPKDPGC